MSYLPIIVCIIGLIVYLAAEGKPSEAGRVSFFAGLLIILLNGVKF